MIPSIDPEDREAKVTQVTPQAQRGPGGQPSSSNNQTTPYVPSGPINFSGSTQQQLMSAAQLAMQVGFTPEQAKIMAAIAGAESTFRPGVVNDNPATGDLSYGLWQINMIGALGPGRRKQFGLSSNDDLKDPLTNAKAAKAIFDSQGFGAWGAYTNGSYNKYLPAAQKLNLSQQQTTTQPPGQQPVTQVSPMAGAGTQPDSENVPLGRTDPFAPVQPAQLTPAITRAGQTSQAEVLREGDMVSGFPVSSPYGMRDHPVYGGERNHGGIDIAAPTGHYVAYDVPVEVLHAGTFGDYGKLVDVWAPSLGLQFRATHLSSIDCSAGQTLQPGQPIGRVGSTGASTGPHIHFEVDTQRGSSRYGGANDPKLIAQGARHLVISPNKPEEGQLPQAAQVSPQQQPTDRAQAVSSRPSYDPMSNRENAGGVVPFPIPGQQQMVGGRGTPMMGGPSTQQVLNSYYKSQLMGFLYKQG